MDFRRKFPGTRDASCEAGPYQAGIAGLQSGDGECPRLMKISIVTPNLNGMPYLPRCIASVRDQRRPGIDVEHIVTDGGSSDGSCEILARQPSSVPGYRFRWSSERDRGMYDAINKGWHMSSGDILAWLNSDEQYLPGTLAAVVAALRAHAAAAFVYGDALLLRPDNSLIAFRKAAPLRWLYVRALHLYIHSSSLFIRRENVMDEKNWLDPRWRAVGDHEWMLRLLKQGMQGHHLPRYLSAFIMTGVNLGLSEQGTRELRALRRREPLWLQVMTPLLFFLKTVEKWRGGGFRQETPLTYHPVAEDGNRVECCAETVSWKCRSS